jgi:hypothetical protein
MDLNKKIKELRQRYILYSVILTHKETKESFIKIGITKNLVERMSYLKDYNYKTLNLVETTGYKARAYESLIFERLIPFEYKYWPKEKFGGHTECYTLPTKEQVDIIFEYIQKDANKAERVKKPKAIITKIKEPKIIESHSFEHNNIKMNLLILDWDFKTYGNITQKKLCNATHPIYPKIKVSLSEVIKYWPNYKEFVYKQNIKNLNK